MLGKKSAWEIMKADYPDQDVIKLGELGPAGVEAEAAKRSAPALPAQASSSFVSREVEGHDMSEAMFPWVTAKDCAACKMFPHFSDYTWDNLPENFDWRELGAVVFFIRFCFVCLKLCSLIAVSFFLFLL